MSSNRKLKISAYTGNGSGRDTYIYQNNGGLYKKGLQNQNSDRSTYILGSMTDRNKKYLPFSNTSISPDKRVKYVPNGTGRDSYIGDSTQKQFAYNAYSRHNHINDLRNYQPKRQMQSSDIFSMVQFQKSQQQQDVEQVVFKHQQKSCSFLSKPKRVNLPKLDLNNLNTSGSYGSNNNIKSTNFLSPQTTGKNLYNSGGLHKKNQSQLISSNYQGKYDQYYKEMQKRIQTEML